MDKIVSVTREQLLDNINQLLDLDKFSLQDYCPNGLQIQGREKIERIVTGVSACYALIEEAIAKKADAIIVHHGYFWKGEEASITGIKYNRIEKIIKNNINLLAYHLPLDVHPILGNNAQLAKLLNIHVLGKTAGKPNQELLWYGVLSDAMTVETFSHFLTEKFNQKPIFIACDKPLIKRIAWCTGAGQKYFEQSINFDVDAYITGEISEQSTWLARELNLHYFAVGHYASERYGVKALGETLSKNLMIKHEFIELNNPI